MILHWNRCRFSWIWISTFITESNYSYNSNS